MSQFQRDMGVEIQGLRERLEQAGISTVDWGRGEAKTLRHLVLELAEGESTLEVDSTGGLVRSVIVGGADVYYTSPTGESFRLFEYRQVFNDGRERRRDLGHAVSEKMKPNEDPIELMQRGVLEELGISGAINLTPIDRKETTLSSPSYPGLTSRYVNFEFRVDLTEEQFKPEGYVEEQPDKKTYFVWRKHLEQ